MARTPASASLPYISGADKTILVLSQADFFAVNALLYALRDDEELLREINGTHKLALGAYHVERLAALWRTIHSMPELEPTPPTSR